MDEIPSDQIPGATSLKYDRSTAEPTLLVPQPSDDPNDPLVCSDTAVNSIFTMLSARMLMVSCIELATMETRPHPCHPVLCHGVMYDLELNHGREYRDNCGI